MIVIKVRGFTKKRLKLMEKEKMSRASTSQYHDSFSRAFSLRAWNADSFKFHSQ